MFGIPLLTFKLGVVNPGKNPNAETSGAVNAGLNKNPFGSIPILLGEAGKGNTSIVEFLAKSVNGVLLLLDNISGAGELDLPTTG